jgi:hypothetical protein
VKQIRRRRREKQICKTENKLESTVLLRLCCFTGHGAAAGAERKRRRKPFRISPAACVSRRRVNPRATSDGGAWEGAPPLFLLSFGFTELVPALLWIF